MTKQHWEDNIMTNQSNQFVDDYVTAFQFHLPLNKSVFSFPSLSLSFHSIVSHLYFVLTEIKCIIIISLQKMIE